MSNDLSEGHALSHVSFHREIENVCVCFMIVENIASDDASQ